MALVTHRGRVADVTPFGKRGALICRVGNTKVRVHPDLASVLGDGDEVYLAGKLSKGVLTALAVNNLSRHKRAGLDATNNMLLIGFMGWLGVQAAALLPMFDDLPLLWGGFLVLTVFGLTGTFRSIRELVLINRAAKWVRYPELA